MAKDFDTYISFAREDTVVCDRLRRAIEAYGLRPATQDDVSVVGAT